MGGDDATSGNERAQNTVQRKQELKYIFQGTGQKIKRRRGAEGLYSNSRVSPIPNLAPNQPGKSVYVGGRHSYIHGSTRVQAQGAVC